MIIQKIQITCLEFLIWERDDVSKPVACVASVFGWFQSKERQRNGLSDLAARELKRELFYSRHFSRCLWLSFLVLCFKTARKAALATQATKRGSFTIYGKTHYHGLRHATFDVLRVFWSLISSGGNLNWRTQRIIGQTKTSLAKK